MYVPNEPPKGMKLNPNSHHVEKVCSGLEKNNGYCPCSIKKDLSTVCPCRECREKNICICKLYLREEIKK